MCRSRDLRRASRPALDQSAARESSAGAARCTGCPGRAICVPGSHISSAFTEYRSAGAMSCQSPRGDQRLVRTPHPLSGINRGARELYELSELGDSSPRVSPSAALRGVPRAERRPAPGPDGLPFPRLPTPTRRVRRSRRRATRLPGRRCPGQRRPSVPTPPLQSEIWNKSQVGVVESGVRTGPCLPDLTDRPPRGAPRAERRPATGGHPSTNQRTAMKGDRVEIVIDAGNGTTRTYNVTATRAGRRTGGGAGALSADLSARRRGGSAGGGASGAG